MTTTTISGGYIVPNDTHLGKWQKEADRLDHDAFLPVFVVGKFRKGDTVLDCGAFNGDHTIAYSNAVGKNGLVIAIEAGEKTFKLLQHNVNLFPFKNVEVHNNCVSNQEDQPIQFNEDPNLGASHCSQSQTSNQAGQTVTLNSIASGRKIDFIKMDIEGYELFALQGATDILEEFAPLMMIEINKGALERAGCLDSQIASFLEDHGYKFTIIQPQCKWGDPQFDIFCSPK